MNEEVHDVKLLPIITATLKQFAEYIGYGAGLEVSFAGQYRCFTVNLISSENESAYIHASFVGRFQEFCLELMKAHGFIVTVKAVYV